MIAKEIHALLVEGTDHWGVQVAYCPAMSFVFVC